MSQIPVDQIDFSSIPIDTRLTIARVTSDPEIMRRLVLDPDARVRNALANNYHNIPEIDLVLAQDPGANEELFGRTRYLAPEVLNVLATQKISSIFRSSIASNKTTPPSALEELGRNRDPYVRRYVAENKNTPVDTLTDLLRDQDPYTQSAAAANPNTPLELVLLELGEQPENDDLMMGLAKRADCPIDRLTTFAHHPNQRVRYAVGSNSAAPEDLLRYVASHGGRMALTRNPNAPPDVLRQIRSDLLRGGREEDLIPIANNPNTPPDVLRLMARQTGFAAQVARANPNLPPEVLEELLNENHMWYAKGVSCNPNATGEMMVRAARLHDSCVAKQANAPEEAYLALNEGEINGEALARSQTTPIEVYRLLAQKTGPDVDVKIAKFALIQNLRVPDEIIEEMVCDRNKDVRERALARLIRSPHALAKAWRTCRTSVPGGMRDLASSASIQEARSSGNLDELISALSQATPKAADGIASDAVTVSEVCSRATESEEALDACQALLSARKRLLRPQ